MWKLKHTKKDHIEHYLFVGEEFTVGRKDASLLITNDPSVSRRHALLFVKHPEENLNDASKKSSLFLRDEKSKYGTFKNGLRISNEVELVAGDVIKFGQFESEYRVVKQEIVVTTSCLELSPRRELKKIIHSLGGNLISEWQPSCTHLVMPEVKVTVKALCCLVSAKPIVTLEYFRELKKSLQSKSSFISHKEYIPCIGEPLINKDQVSFDINPQRSSLFKDKLFFFLEEKQFKKLHLGIMLGGGHASILTKDTPDLHILLGESVCVIEPGQGQMDSQESKALCNQVNSILKRNDLRMIAESDIGLAVAYCSTEKFCNPKYTLGEILTFQRIQSQSLTQREVYVPDTERFTREVQKFAKVDKEMFSSLHLSSVNKEVAEEVETSQMALSAKVERKFDDIFGDLIENKVDEPERVDTFPPTSPEPPPTKRQRRAATKKLNEGVQKSMVDETERIDTSPPTSPEPPPSKRLRRAATKKLGETSPIQEVHSPGENDRVEIPTVKHEIVEETLPETLPANGQRNQLQQMEDHSPKENGQVNRRKIKTEIMQDSSPEKLALNGRNSPVEDIKSAVQLEPELPRNLVKIEYVSLICRKPAPVVQVYGNGSVKNFKKFKKVQPKKTRILPQIIGAHELVPHDRVTVIVANEVWEDSEEEVVQQPVRGEFDWDTPGA